MALWCMYDIFTILHGIADNSNVPASGESGGVAKLVVLGVLKCAGGINCCTQSPKWNQI